MCALFVKSKFDQYLSKPFRVFRRGIEENVEVFGESGKSVKRYGITADNQ